MSYGAILVLIADKYVKLFGTLFQWQHCILPFLTTEVHRILPTLRDLARIPKEVENRRRLCKQVYEEFLEDDVSLVRIVIRAFRERFVGMQDVNLCPRNLRNSLEGSFTGVPNAIGKFLNSKGGIHVDAFCHKYFAGAQVEQSFCKQCAFEFMPMVFFSEVYKNCKRSVRCSPYPVEVFTSLHQNYVLM